LSHGLRLALLGLVPLVVLLLGVFLFRAILLPFLVGMAAAYMLDPAADRLQRWGVGRTSATLLITISFFVVLVVVLVLILPPLAAQATELATQLPEYLEGLRQRVVPTLAAFLARFDVDLDLSAEGLFRRYSTQGMEVLLAAGGGLLQSGVALLNLVSLIFVTPIVTFYLLRDWDRMVARIWATIPPDVEPTLRRLATDVDEVLAGFIRGQGMVCLFLALFYACGLWLVGLRYGLIIGLLTGFFSFIPYIGMTLGLVVGLAVAAFQFQDLLMIGLVAGVFALGQFIEGNLISPRLVGSRIHLHPVWVIFAVLAGTVSAGVLGTLLAVPVAGVIGVLLRFALERYRASELYTPAAAQPGLCGGALGPDHGRPHPALYAPRPPEPGSRA
jgi:predicted PurR-regulated permease PerM